MATITQELELYRKFLELLEPLGSGVFGRGAGMIGISGISGKSGLSGSVFPRELGATIQRFGNGRFLYTDLGSAETFGGYGTGAAWGGIRGNVRGAGVTLGMLETRGMPEMLEMSGGREVGSVRSAVNYRNVGTEAARTAYEGPGGQDALRDKATRYGESPNRRSNGGRTSWAGDILAPIDRSWNVLTTVSERISGIRGERNTVSEKIRTGERSGERNAVFIKNARETRETRQTGQTAKSTETGYAGKIRENKGTGSGSAREAENMVETPRSRSSGGADEVIERLCGALREAAFSMSEGVHY